ncbi:hypothetical protein [Streptomyces buecherae]|uniref:hypothetical protein n=1 Tax=Streptomyces buecherae TaxID=2763006 RepID=UPI00164DA175|nr:hypothetical protein [Streptomyces buecherae]QNJ42009.1 hypothetical protein H7H31_21245 [Streptomyces buecherae]
MIEYPYTISEYSRAAVDVLGYGWDGDSGFLGAYGLIWRKADDRTFRVWVDAERDDESRLMVADKDDSARFVEVPLTSEAPTDAESLREVGRAVAAAVLSVVGVHYHISVTRELTPYTTCTRYDTEPLARETAARKVTEAFLEEEPKEWGEGTGQRLTEAVGMITAFGSVVAGGVRIDVVERANERCGHCDPLVGVVGWVAPW